MPRATDMASLADRARAVRGQRVPSRAILVCGAFCALIAGCAAPPLQSVQRSAPATSVDAIASAAADGMLIPRTHPAYRFAVGDEVEVRYPGRPELSQTLPIAPDGRLAVAYLAPVDAAGKSADELTAALAGAVDALTPSGAAAAQTDYLLTAGDDIDVRFTRHPTLNQSARVRPDGRISLSLVKTVIAEGRTPEDLEAQLVELYRAFLKQPDLTVVVRGFNAAQARVRVGGVLLPQGLAGARPIASVRSFAAPQVFVGGEVARPGVLGFRSRMTLLQAITEAGGYKPTGELRSVLVLRKTDDGAALTIRRNLLADLTSAQTNDIELQASDVVILPKTAIASAAEAVDQYVYQLLAPLKNSSFSFAYGLGTTRQVITTK